MKQLTTYNRAASYLNKLFNLLNQRFFESELTMPTITIQSTPKAYGHFSLREDAWVSAVGATHEINIGAGTLARPIEHICATPPAPPVKKSSSRKYVCPGCGISVRATKVVHIGCLDCGMPMVEEIRSH